MFHGFHGEVFSARKRTREILNTCIQNILRFVPEVKYAAVKEALERKQDLTMSIYRYLQPVNSLPQPDGPLSSSLPPVAIKEANKSVETVYSTLKKRKRGTYDKLMPEQQNTLCLLLHAAQLSPGTPVYVWVWS